MGVSGDMQRALDVLPAKTVRAMLDEMLSLRDRVKRGESVNVPLATFHLRSGRDVTGTVLDGRTEEPGACLLLHVPGDLRSPAADVAYVSPGDIEAITVRDTERVVKEISFGRVQVAPGEPTPGKLEINRRLPELSGELSEKVGAKVVVDVAWEGIPDLGTARKLLLDLVEDIGAVIKEIAATEMGREALQKKVKKIWIGDGPRPTVAQQGDTLVVTANFGRGLDGRLIRGALRVETEKLL